MRLCSQIWGGDDYIPYVWNEWLQEHSAKMWTAELEGEVAGFIRLDSQAPHQYWLHGLRVHPKMQGMGIGRRLWDTAMAAWGSDGVIRFYTAEEQYLVRHMADLTGFSLLTKFLLMAAEPIKDQNSDFSPLQAGEGQVVLEFWNHQNRLNSHHLVDMGWEWYAPDAELIEDHFLSKKFAWGWKDQQGLLLGFWEEWEGRKGLFIAGAVCEPEYRDAFLMDCRRLAAEKHADYLGWNIPLGVISKDQAQGWGFTVFKGEDTEYLYEKTGMASE